LLLPYDVNWVRDGKKFNGWLFISDPELFDITHVDTVDESDGGVVEQGVALSEVDGEGTGFSTIECCVDQEGKKDEAF
jgi:hypothetical protein